GRGPRRTARADAIARGRWVADAQATWRACAARVGGGGRAGCRDRADGLARRDPRPGRRRGRVARRGGAVAAARAAHRRSGRGAGLARGIDVDVRLDAQALRGDGRARRDGGPGKHLPGAPGDGCAQARRGLGAHREQVRAGRTAQGAGALPPAGCAQPLARGRHGGGTARAAAAGPGACGVRAQCVVRVPPRRCAAARAARPRVRCEHEQQLDRGKAGLGRARVRARRRERRRGPCPRPAALRDRTPTRWRGGRRRMKLAVFTNRFPGKISTFFSRDLRALIEAGAEPEIFPIYPGDARLWRFVPSILADVLPRERVHHLASLGGLRASAALPAPAMRLFAREVPRFAVAAARYGAAPLAKTLFVLPIAAAWAARHAHRFDHVLAYWGNYAGTCAYLAHRLAGRDIPFSIYLHAGTDLFRTQVLLDEKLRYADRIVTEGEFNRRFIADLYPDLFPSIAPRIQVNLMGLDLAEFPYRPEGRAPHRVLGVGALAEAKGYHVLLRALGRLAREDVPFELELVGDGEEAGPLRALARSLGIADRVRFRGWLHFDDVRRAMLEATLFVHPS